MNINFDFSDLKAFLAVRETGSFHRAAERLNMSQSAVTRRKQKLETALDSVLFARTTRTVRPTLAAKRLQVWAEAILEDACEAAHAMRDESVAYAHQRNAIVTLAIVPTAISRLLTPVLRAFRAEGHAARLRLIDVAANEVAETVAQGEADFGVCSIPLVEPNTVFEPLFEEKIVLTTPRKHRLTRYDTVSWSQLQGETLIVPARGTGNRLLIDEAMAQARLQLTWTIEVQRSNTAVELVSEGCGVALLPRTALMDADAPTMTIRPFVGPELVRTVGLLSRTGQPDTGRSRR